MQRRVDIEAVDSGWRIIGRILFVGPQFPPDMETLWRGEEPLLLKQLPDLASAVYEVFALRPAWTGAQSAAIEVALNGIRCTQGSGALLGAPRSPVPIASCPIHGNELVPGRLAPVDELRASGYREVWEILREAREAQLARAGPVAA